MRSRLCILLPFLNSFLCQIRRILERFIDPAQTRGIHTNDRHQQSRKYDPGGNDWDDYDSHGILLNIYRAANLWFQNAVFSLCQTVQPGSWQLRQSSHHAVRELFRPVTLRPWLSAGLPFLCLPQIIRFWFIAFNSKYILVNRGIQYLWLAVLSEGIAPCKNADRELFSSRGR